MVGSLAPILVVASCGGVEPTTSDKTAVEFNSSVGDATAPRGSPSASTPGVGSLPQSEVDAIIRLGATGAGPPPDTDHAHGHGAADPQPPTVLDEATTTALDAELEVARSVIADLDTIEEAAAQGYLLATVPSPGIGTHWVRWSQIEQPFDVRAPAMLLFDHHQSPPELVGYSYALQSETEPVGFVGDADRWHRHTGLCVRLDGWVVRERAASREACDGSFIAGGDFWMLHAWIVPGWDNRLGTFAPMNPKLCPASAGTPDFLRCPAQPQL